MGGARPAWNESFPDLERLGTRPSIIMASKPGRHRARDEDLDSEFEFSAEKRRKTWRDDPIASQKAFNLPHHSAAIPSKEFFSQEQDKEEWKARRFHLLSMDAYSRHKALVNHYLFASGRGIEHVQRSTEGDRNDYSVLREEHKFLWDTEDDADTWEKRLAKTYYDRLFKEYAIADLSRYKENKIALRWRTEKEVTEGKGQFECGNKYCLERENLESWEVNFGYIEQEEKRNALVKLRLCPECSVKLNYHHMRKRWKKSDGKKHKKRKHRRHKHKHERDYEWKERTVESKESGSSEESEEEGPEKKASAIWSKPAEAFLEKSKEEEFDDYFKDMLL